MRPTQKHDSTSELTAADKPACRENTSMIAAYFRTPVLLGWRALVAQLSIERGSRVTGQHALAEAIADYFQKHGVEPPKELMETVKNADPPSRRGGPARKSRNQALVHH